MRGNYTEEAINQHAQDSFNTPLSLRKDREKVKVNKVVPMPMPSTAQTQQVRTMAPGSGRGKVRHMFKRFKDSMKKKTTPRMVNVKPIDSSTFHPV